MITLGLNGNFSGEDGDIVPGMQEFLFHDASACLVRDGVLVAAVEEERLNRIKKTTKFPTNAVRACLDRAGVTPADIDGVGYYFREDYMDTMLGQLYTAHPQVPIRYSRDLVKDRLRDAFDWDLADDRLVYTRHHVAHAMSSFARSGMDSALVLVMDGRGEEDGITVFRADAKGLETLAAYPAMDSLGSLYLFATQLIGYGFGDEYKVMGLAPYGDPARYRSLLSALYTLGDEGRYTLHHNTITPNLLAPSLLADGFVPRRKGQKFTQQHMDLAAALQETVETISLHLLAHWRSATGLTKLVFGGGVAHNCSLNGVVLRSGLFDEMFVHPASHDAGAGEGAALAAAAELDKRNGAGTSVPGPRVRLRSASVGPALGTGEEVADRLRAWGEIVEFDRAGDIVAKAAALLADGKVLGWAHGPSEFGPRALGNRSIVADPRPKANQDRINAMVKKRESFRPFAPVVTSEAAADYFEIPDAMANYDFMSFVVRVRPDRCDELGAVTHIDGTARLQIVDAEANERFHRLVTAFGELTGTPVLLNTSFNNNAEPIVQTVEDALTCFLTTDLDYLVVEDFLVRRRPGHVRRLDRLALRFRPVTRLARTVRTAAEGNQAVSHEIYLDYSPGPRAEISPELHALLEAADGVTPIGRLGRPLDDALLDELHDLWQQRFFVLRPCTQ